ncbi:hypothetical protein CGRA01v4_03478 [Colletotrichum graminicola]|nr:hypothetical protein CGRA01v4_03478 [Colletotrichum graminicola]
MGQVSGSGSIPRAVSCVRVAVRWQLSLVTFRSCSPLPGLINLVTVKTVPLVFAVQRRPKGYCESQKCDVGTSAQEKTSNLVLTGGQSDLSWLAVHWLPQKYPSSPNSDRPQRLCDRPLATQCVRRARFVTSFLASFDAFASIFGRENCASSDPSTSQNLSFDCS